MKKTDEQTDEGGADCSGQAGPCGNFSVRACVYQLALEEERQEKALLSLVQEMNKMVFNINMY